MFSIGIKYFWSSMQRGRLKNVLRLTIFSLSINIGVFIVGVALIRGFQTETLTKVLHVHGHAQADGFVDIKDLNVEIKPPEYYLFNTFPLLKQFILQINQYTGIYQQTSIKLEKVIKKYELQGGISKNRVTDGILVQGLNDQDSEYLLNKYIKFGSTKLKSSDRQECAIIGYRLADRLNIGVGDKLDLILKSGPDIDSIPLKVTGIFDLGFYEYDSNLIFVNSDLLQEYKPNHSHIIYINKPESIDLYINKIKEINPNMYLSSWKQKNRLIQDMFDSQIRAISIVMGFFILSAIIQSITSLFVLLSERSYDLAVLTTLGMSNSQKYAMFSAYGLLISLSNTLFGTLAGIGLVTVYPHFQYVFENLTGQKIIHSDAFWVSDFSPKLFWSDILSISLATLIVMSIAMLIAAHFTSRIEVLESLKN